VRALKASADAAVAEGSSAAAVQAALAKAEAAEQQVRVAGLFWKRDALWGDGAQKDGVARLPAAWMAAVGGSELMHRHLAGCGTKAPSTVARVRSRNPSRS
jgi:microsomal dipeptidase-like Zn-dependent dipeptidase